MERWLERLAAEPPASPTLALEDTKSIGLTATGGDAHIEGDHDVWTTWLAANPLRGHMVSRMVVAGIGSVCAGVWWVCLHAAPLHVEWEWYCRAVGCG
jgi:hypothetical protein